MVCAEALEESVAIASRRAEPRKVRRGSARNQRA